MKNGRLSLLMRLPKAIVLSQQIPQKGPRRSDASAPNPLETHAIIAAIPIETTYDKWTALSNSLWQQLLAGISPGRALEGLTPLPLTRWRPVL